eukprot:2958695-Ditylum_brightwellii.AAC.1
MAVRCVGSEYQPPLRQTVGGELLDFNFLQCKGQNQEEVLTEADIYGLTYMGDGATLKRLLLINMLASSKSYLVTVLETAD